MKEGFEIIFMAPRARHHQGKPVLDEIVRIAASQGIKRHTRRTDSESVGVGGHVHSAHFFELADEPEEVMFVVGPSRAEKLLHAVEEEGVPVYCVRRKIEHARFGNEGRHE